MLRTTFPLHDAALYGDLPALLRLLGRSDRAGHATGAGGEAQTPPASSREYVQALDERNHEGATPLYLAASQGHLAVCELLLDQFNVEIDAIKSESEQEETKNADASPLLIATRNGHLPVVDFLVQRGASVDFQKKRGATPLFIAAQTGYLEIVRYLVDQGRAQVDVPTDYGATPLYIASQNGHVNIAKFLIARGANVNRLRDCNISALYIASQNGHVEVAKTLVESGADVQMAREGGITPLYIASQNGHVEVIKFLLSVWSHSHSALTNHGISPLMIACQASHVEVVKTLHAAGADLFLETDFPLDALEIAMRCGAIDIVRYFLAWCDDPEKRVPEESVGASVGVRAYLTSIANYSRMQIAVEARLPSAIVHASRIGGMDPLVAFNRTRPALQLATSLLFPSSPPVSAEVVRLVRSICAPFSPANAHLFPASVSVAAHLVLCLAARIESAGTSALPCFVPCEIWLMIASFFRHETQTDKWSLDEDHMAQINA